MFVPTPQTYHKINNHNNKKRLLSTTPVVITLSSYHVSNFCIHFWWWWWWWLLLSYWYCYLMLLRPGSIISIQTFGSINIKRQRFPVDVIFRDMRPKIIWRAYRMPEWQFWELYDDLLPCIESHHSGQKRKRGSTVWN